jgi:hypothetical protein
VAIEKAGKLNLAREMKKPRALRVAQGFTKQEKSSSAL